MIYIREVIVISDFRVCGSSALDSLYITYCMLFMGCELSNLNCNYIKDFKVAWRKIKRRIWRLTYKAHNAIVHQLSYDIDHQLETRMIKFVHLCLNHSNHVCSSIISSKLHCIKSTFASNYKYLSYRYNNSHDDWYKDISHLIGKVKLKFQQDFHSRNTAQTLEELCAIRDGLSTCNPLSYLHVDACELNNLISLD